MGKKKILYFMPDNPLSGKAGNLTRAKEMLDFFERNHQTIEVDFFSVKDWGVWNEKTIKNFHIKYPHIKLHLHNRKIPVEQPVRRILGYKIPNFFHKLIRGNSIDISGFMLKTEMQNLINKNKYDIAVISYAVWGSLIENLTHQPYLINDTHDFITAQSRHKKNKIGQLFQSEIGILNQFDDIWTYSVEEEYIFEQFTDKKVTLIPVSFPLNFNTGISEFKYDIIYVASENPHNIAGISWFLKEVLPFLKDKKVHIIGKICNAIGDYKNVVKYGMVDDLDDFYSHSKVAICPMLSGTGIKIKVIEALSYGIPVVTNRRGVDGLVNKKENGCLVSDDPKRFADDIIRLVEDETFYQKTRSEGISYFKNNHDPKLEAEIMNRTFL